MIEPNVSLIICTKNRADALKKCLTKINELIVSNVSWELIVVDNNSSDNTAAIVQEFIKESSISIKYVVEYKKGSGAARNCGWKNAAKSSLVLIYTDDDCYPERDYIDQHWMLFNSQPDCVFVGGRVLLYDPDDLPVTIQTRDTPYSFKPYEHVYAGFIHSANIAIRKDALDAIGGWDDRLGAGTTYPSEDLDVIARLLAVGFSGVYDPKPCVFHHHGRKDASTIASLMQGYDAGRGGFFGKCLLQKDLRRIYIWPWIKRWRYQAKKTTLRELKYCFIYLVESIKLAFFTWKK